MPLLDLDALIQRTIDDYLDPEDVAEWVPLEDPHDWSYARSTVDTCLQALHHHLQDTALPAMTYCWDANSDGLLDGWAMMVSFYPKDHQESFSLGMWGDDSDLSDDDTLAGVECAKAILSNFLQHYDRLLRKAIALDIWTAPEEAA